jgi:polar amino acid transport system substrate-binding protein
MKRLSTIVAVLVFSLGLPALILGQTKSGLSSEIAPRGKIRIGTIGIEVVGGVAQPVGKFIADRLGLPFEPIVYVTPEAWAGSFGKGEWDLAIGPRAVAPGGMSDVVSDLWLVDLIYLAAPEREFADTTQIDRPGVKIGVIKGSPSDRYLTRTLKSAQLVRIALSPNIVADTVEMLRNGKAVLFGADSGVVYAAAKELPGAKILPGVFSTVQQTMLLPKGRSAAAQAKFAELAAEAKRTGVVQKAIERRGLKGVRVAPE